MRKNLIAILSVVVVAGPLFSIAADNQCIQFYNAKPAQVAASAKKGWFSFSPSFRTKENGKIQLQPVKSKNQVLEDSVNALAQILLGRTLKIHEFEKVIDTLKKDSSNDPYFVKLARAFRIEIDVNREELEKKIPKTGPLMIVANHPKNGSDGIALSAAISFVRGDVKIALTSLLSGLPGLPENAFLLNLNKSTDAKTANEKMLSEIEAHLAEGKAIVIFPSGQASVKENLEDNFALDRAWKLGAVNLLRRVPETQVVPIFVDGMPSQEYHSVKLSKYKAIAKHLSFVFHIREIWKNMDRPMSLVVGSPMKGENLIKDFSSANDIAQYLRATTYSLKGRLERKSDNRTYQDIRIVDNKDALAKELAGLEPIVRTGKISVYMAKGSDIPETLQKLGELREKNFRKEGEGTGSSSDLTPHDTYYHHVVAVDNNTGTILAAYRLGLGDKIIEGDPSGNYKRFSNSNLFDLSKLPVDQMKQSVEFGRSFSNHVDVGMIDAAKGFSAVWKGIGAFLAQNPQYRYLMGPVSMSNVYSDISIKIMIKYLLKTNSSSAGHLVQALNPPGLKTNIDAEIDLIVGKIETLDDLNKKILDIDGVGIPPLLKSYSKLGAQYLGFNHNALFNTVSGLIVVDLVKAAESPETRREVEKNMSKDGFEHYLKSREAIEDLAS